MIDFYTVIIRKSANYWVALCLENGLVGQGNTPEQSIDQLKQAIESFSEIYEAESDISLSPLASNEFHEFLTLENATTLEIYEVKKVYA
jgi:predicted RNase H-like HicB family nuclease